MLRSIENQTLDPSFCLQQQTPEKGASTGDARASDRSLLPASLLKVGHGPGHLESERERAGQAACPGECSDVGPLRD